MPQSWVNGLVGIFVDSSIKFQSGHVRITTDEFKKREKFMPVDEIIPDSDNLIKKISKIEGVSYVRERIRFGILLGREETTVQAVGMGIDLKNNEFKFGEKLKSGKVTDSGIYIGDGLAKKLGVKIGEELLLATKTSEGGLNGIKLKVDGIFKLGMMYDKKFFFISLADAKKLLKIYDGTTEILVFADSRDMADETKKKIVKTIPEWLLAETYREMLGDFMELLEAMKSVIRLYRSPHTFSCLICYN